MLRPGDARVQHVAADADLERPRCCPKWSRSVSRSSSPCVGCSCLPSPALMTFDSDALGEELRRARRAVADHHHVDPHRLEVARRVDQRLALATPTTPCVATFTVSADSRFSANSNEMRVRVEASKKRLTIVLPRSVGTFLIGRSLISLNGSAVSRISRICSALSGSSPSRSLPSERRHVAPPARDDRRRLARRAPRRARPPGRRRRR